MKPGLIPTSSIYSFSSLLHSLLQASVDLSERINLEVSARKVVKKGGPTLTGGTPLQTTHFFSVNAKCNTEPESCL